MRMAFGGGSERRLTGDIVVYVGYYWCSFSQILPLPLNFILSVIFKGDNTLLYLMPRECTHWSAKLNKEKKIGNLDPKWKQNFGNK